MLIYEFKYNDCNHKFDTIESIKELNQYKEISLKCNCGAVTQVIGAANVITSKMS